MPEGIQYQIIRADKAGCPAIPDLVFTDPAEAANASRRLSREMGEKLMVKLIVNDQWKKRELARIKDGTYRELPWAYLDWWKSDMVNAIRKDHFAHPSLERPGWIAYTKSAEDGMKDKQTIVRPGTYLKTYFTRSMDYYGLIERGLVTLFMDAYGPLDVKFATTEDEIVSVYDNGPDTCMKGREWPNERNPAHIYAAGDLQVAYLGDLDDASARTLVWPEKKIYSRVYGDIARLTKGLERMGYRWGAPIGARLKRIEMREVKFDPNRGPPSHCFIAPYIDKRNERGGGHLSVLDKGDHLEICAEGEPGSHHCGLADGYSGLYVPREDEQPTFTCDRCDGAGHAELITVYTDAEGEDEESWCNDCRRKASFRCGHSGGFFSVDNVERVIVGAQYWNKYYADMYAANCEMTKKLVTKDELIVIHFKDGPKKVWNGWVNDNGGAFKSAISGKYYMKTDRARVQSEYGAIVYLGKNELKHHTFVCDDCSDHVLIRCRNQPDGKDKLYCDGCCAPKMQLNKTSSSTSIGSMSYKLASF